jgi:SAM-dependent methyltransferase
MPLFRRNTATQPLVVAMTGIKMGDRLLQIGCADRTLLTDLARKVGLSGRAAVVAYDEEDAARARDAAARAGILVDVELVRGGFPFDSGTFDLAVVDNTGGLLSESRPETRVGCLREGLRVLRPAGRAIVVEPMPRGGILGVLARQRREEHFEASGGTETALEAEGFTGVRVLVERDGRRFVEGTKRRA